MRSAGDLPADLVGRIVARVRLVEPAARAILVHGSYATGTAYPDSDLDLAVVIAGSADVHYRTWFEQRDGELPLHVSARTDLTVEAWRRESREPEGWAFGLPTEHVHTWLWIGDRSVVRAIGDPPVQRKPGSPPEIEDMMEVAVKIRRAAASGDRLGLRLWAHDLPRYSAPIVVRLNDVHPVRDPRAALGAILALTVAPDGWEHDVTALLGLRHVDDAALAESAKRLTLGVLRLVRDMRPDVDPQPDVARYVADGTFERILLDG